MPGSRERAHDPPLVRGDGRREPRLSRPERREGHRPRRTRGSTHDAPGLGDGGLPDARLRAGEAEFEDEESEGRSKSLGASLQYGFGHAFTEKENKKLALLFFFQGFVDVDALRLMGDPDDEWCVPEVQNMTNDDWINLLDRAAEVGLLTQLGGGYYHIHPALPWYFKKLFERYYPSGVQNLDFAVGLSRPTTSLAKSKISQQNQDFALLNILEVFPDYLVTFGPSSSGGSLSYKRT